MKINLTSMQAQRLLRLVVNAPPPRFDDDAALADALRRLIDDIDEAWVAAEKLGRQRKEEWGSAAEIERLRGLEKTAILYAALADLLPYFEGEHHPDHPHCRQARAALLAAKP